MRRSCFAPEAPSGTFAKPLAGSLVTVFCFCLALPFTTHAQQSNSANVDQAQLPVGTLRRLIARKHLLQPSVTELPESAEGLVEWLVANDPFAAIDALKAEPEIQLGGFLISGREQRLLIPLTGGLLHKAGLTEPLKLTPQTDPSTGFVSGQLTRTRLPFELTVTDETRERYGSDRKIRASAMYYESGSTPVLRVYDMVPALTWQVVRRLLETKVADRTPILDLRYCAGGDIYEALDFASLWSDQPSAFASLVDAAGRTTELTTTVGSTLGLPAPTIVWTSRFTASACELLVIGLRHHQKITVVGEETRGKCTVQSSFRISDSHQVRFTSGYYTGPEGRQCKHSGIEPNVHIVGNLHDDAVYLLPVNTDGN